MLPIGRVRRHDRNTRLVETGTAFGDVSYSATALGSYEQFERSPAVLRVIAAGAVCTPDIALTVIVAIVRIVANRMAPERLAENVRLDVRSKTLTELVVDGEIDAAVNHD